MAPTIRSRKNTRKKVPTAFIVAAVVQCACRNLNSTDEQMITDSHDIDVKGTPQHFQLLVAWIPVRLLAEALENMHQ
jgi:hypothetical protein